MSKNLNEWQAFMGKNRIPGEMGNGQGDHYQDFINAIRANDQRLANGDIRQGFYSCALIHLANISYRLRRRSEEHTSELQSLMRISYAVFCLKNNKRILA